MKVEDFKFALRGDERLLGRAMEQLFRDKKIKDDRKVAGLDDGGAGTGGLEAVAAEGGVGAEDLKSGKKRRKRKRVDGEEGGEEERAGKRVTS